MLLVSMAHTRFDNEGGSVSAIFFFVTGLIFIAFYLIMIVYPMVNGTTVAYNNFYSTSTYPVSQAHQDSMWFLQQAINASGFIGFIFMIVSLILISLREKYGVT
jgi:hypothetical protein